ncbi:hypothetical protein PUN28_005272 [Cardiocondyla obscurior]|uniref:Ribosomal protein S14 n=1 Tax=Cardiocondyla obscurior TaxID=286306 RepID=A0AAW2GF20_9HYME
MELRVPRWTFDRQENKRSDLHSKIRAAFVFRTYYEARMDSCEVVPCNAGLGRVYTGKARGRRFGNRKSRNAEITRGKTEREKEIASSNRLRERIRTLIISDNRFAKRYKTPSCRHRSTGLPFCPSRLPREGSPGIIRAYKSRITRRKIDGAATRRP